ncbi:MAG: ABC transporter permease [Spirochaetes bacterium]|nr:ABC transporter permease [Spirochaetota bacterium]
MKFLLRLAWKNLSRYRKRTIITAAALAVGLGAYIFMDSWILGIEKESERNLVWYETSSARALDDGYWEQKDRLPLKYTIDEPEAVLGWLAGKKIPAAPRTVFGGELIMHKDPFLEDGSLTLRVLAIDPVKDDTVFRLKETIEAGRYLEPGEEKILIGAWLAADLGAEVGYPLTVVTRTRDGYYQTIDVEIAGIFNCPNPAINKGTVFIPLDTADRYLEMNGAVTEINLRLPEREDADALAAALESDLAGVAPGLDVKSWRDLAEDYLAFAGMKKSASNIILILVFIIAAVGISNTMIMAINERTKELGMMRALGMKDSEIRLAFLLEAGGIGFIGAVMGVVLGVVLSYWIVSRGVDMGGLIGDMDIGYRVHGLFRGAWHPEAMVTAFIFGIVLTVLVSFLSTGRALRRGIADSLRYS